MKVQTNFHSSKQPRHEGYHKSLIQQFLLLYDGVRQAA
jgi:hypothetical protein